MNASLIPPTKRGPTLRTLCLCLLLVGLLPSLRAGQFGLFTYERVEDTIEITGYPQDAVGAVEIPAMIEGLPVTRLGPYAFQGTDGLTSVILPAGLTSIGEGAFYGSTGLTSVTFPAGLISIGGGAFHYCTRLTSATLPTGLTTIGGSAFDGCSGLTSLTLPEGLIHIAPRAFAGCSGLTSVTLPARLISIGVAAFYGCTGLTSVTIPTSVTRIEGSAFASCTGLVAIDVEAGNPSYFSDGGVLFGVAQNTLVQFPAGRAGNYGIPASVTRIEPGAFIGCSGLTSVTLPAALTVIEPATFYDCTGLTSMTLPASVTIIGGRAFSGCAGLTSVALPAGLISIGADAFEGCTGLNAINVQAGNPAFASDDGALLNAAKTSLLLFPQGKAGHYDIPASVTSIVVGAFEGCTMLTSIKLQQGLRRLGDSMFSGCTGLTNVSLPVSVTVIGSGAFYGCAGLTSVTLPARLTSIGEFAFYGCSGFTNITIPESVISIGNGAFRGCTGLNAINVKAGNQAYASVGGVLFDVGQNRLIQFPMGRAGNYGVPAGVFEIGTYAFYGCTGLTNVTLPEGLTTIEAGAFVNCTGLTSVTIPASVTVIGWEIPRHPPVYFYYPAFSGCTALTKAVFLGDAPFLVETEFSNAAPGFTLYYFSNRGGFTSPTWIGHPATMINEATYPAAVWLLTHGLGYDTQLDLDPDGDGVDLLTAYALNLDPRVNLQGRLPAPMLGADSLSLNFHASTPGITYRVETSTDLTDWTTTGVTQTAPDANGRSTASVLRDAPHRFLRLVFQD